jgi:hypothetical protein
MIETQELETLTPRKTRRDRGRSKSAALALPEPSMQADEEVRSVRLAKRLGWLSIGLGVTQLAAPGVLTRLTGLRGTGASRTTMRLLGLRGITAGLGILARRRPTGWLWGRVAGDLMDLTLLAGGSVDGAEGRRRAALALVSLMGIAAIDVTAAKKLGRVDRAHPGASAERRRLAHTQSITLNASADDVAARWVSFAASESPRLSEVRFVAAPGGRGTEIHAEHGPLQALGVKALLRRFKQIVETGEVVHSDASIHLGPHPGQPTSKTGKGNGQ